MKGAIIYFILPVFLLSQQLEIPEITVFGERQIIVEPIEKQLLPFEKDLISPTYENKKAAFPSIKEEKLVEVKRNFGFIARTDGGSKYEGYLIGYLRNYYYPLQVGISGMKNSNIEDDLFNVFSRMSYNNLYFNTGYIQRSNSAKISYLYLSGYFPTFSGDLELAYSDSLIADANIDLSFIPFYFEIGIDDDLKYQLKALYKRYPFEAGLSIYEERIYPELVYFLPFPMSLYIKGSLLERDGISQILTGLPQFRWECNNFNPYYRAEIGIGTTPGVSLFYSSETLIDTLEYTGIAGKYKGIQLEFGYPIKEGSAYLRAGTGLRVRDLIDVNVYCYVQSEDRYYLSTDIGYFLSRNIRIGARGEIVKGWKDEFEITGYLSLFL
jgi:hypothetical protein